MKGKSFRQVLVFPLQPLPKVGTKWTSFEVAGLSHGPRNVSRETILLSSYYITPYQKLKLGGSKRCNRSERSCPVRLVERLPQFCNLVNLCYTDTSMGKTILLTGKPRVGKTTVIKDVVRRLAGQAGGFYTEEMRERGRRQGFRIVTLEGQEGILAHVSIKSRMRVSKYGVNLADLEAIGVTAIREAVAQKDYVVVDEIGKMELFSRPFKDAVWEAIHSHKPVLGTIALASHPWADSVKALPQVTVIEVTPANRDKMARRILDLFEQ